VGYRGSMNLIFEISNLMIDQITHHHPGDWPLTPEALRAAAGPGAIPAATLTPSTLASASS
jgi:nitrogenase molybdenum-iron protein NifN